MSKRIALKDYVEVDGIDLSNFAHSVALTSQHNRVDVSGFNSTGSDEFLAGNTTQSITVDFWMGGDADEPQDVLYRLHRDRTIFTFKWRKDQTQPVSATNREWQGNAQLLTYGEGANRGDAETASFEFTAADETGFVLVET